MNVNEYVWVKLTKDGRRIYAEHHAQFAHLGITAPRPAYEWLRFQLWELMNLFGPHCDLGMASPFEGGEVLFEEPLPAPTHKENEPNG